LCLKLNSGQLGLATDYAVRAGPKTNNHHLRDTNTEIVLYIRKGLAYAQAVTQPLDTQASFPK